MSRSQRLNSILNQAKGKEKKYNWLGAAGLYEQALGSTPEKDLLRKGEVQERIGYCFNRAAFQAETREEFKSRMEQSLAAYEEAARLLEKVRDAKKQARIDFCIGMVSYDKVWLAEDSSERKALLDECWKLEKEALRIYEETGDNLSYGKVCNELLTCLYDRLFLAWDWREWMKILDESMEYGEKAIEALFEVGDMYELVRAHYMLSLHLFWAADVFESIEKQKELKQESLSYAQKALDISEKTGDSYLIGMSNWLIGWIIMDLKGDFESSLRHCEKALGLGKKINDKLLMANALEILAYVTIWKTVIEEDPDNRRKGFSEAFQYAEDALAHYQWLSYPIPSMAYVAHAECYWYLAFDETNLEEKRVLLEKAVEVGRKDLEQAKHSGSPNATSYVHHSLSKAFYSLSTLATKTSEKRKMLEEASTHRENDISICERLFPFMYWNRGVSYNYSALIKAELAKIETDNRVKEDLLKKAIADMEDCLKFCRMQVEGYPQAKQYAVVGVYQHWFGGILNQLYLLTGEKRHLERAIRVYGNASQAWEKADQHSRIAETYWQIAKLHGYLGEHSKAASKFESAAERYKLAAEKIPQLKAFCTDYALYMQAWSEIERAKHHHAEKQHGQAKEHYERAANLHKSTERWNYLTPNYLAWARLEEGEGLSRKEETEKAKDLFQQAARQFAEAKISIQTKREKIESTDEKEMLVQLAKASEVRHEYCLGRIFLEEAKILDRQGHHAASSGKYGSAAETFQKATDAMEHETDRQELKPIISLCKAWQRMTRAEAEASPDFYFQASQLFEEAKEQSLDEKARLLALGHSNFCKALEAGTRFEVTRDPTLHSAATQHLEGAATCYIRAGFRTASEYAKATQRLFDAYMYMHKAQTVTEPREKAQYFQVAEKLLQASAGSFMKAKHPEKSEQVQRLLESVKEERQIAMTLTEVLHVPTIASATTSFSTPTATHEEAVGLERFEHADIQANLILRVREARVGEDVNLEIELINAGRAPALLIKVEKAIPEGFEFKAVPETYRAEDSFLDLKGKRLNPLKTEEVKMVIQPLSKGTFTMKPRIRYLDENGKYRSHEPEPATITVKELGIKGWIKGER